MLEFLDFFIFLLKTPHVVRGSQLIPLVLIFFPMDDAATVFVAIGAVLQSVQFHLIQNQKTYPLEPKTYSLENRRQPY